MQTFFKGVGKVVLAAVLIASLFVIVAALPIDGPYDIRVVTSGSMEPAIKTGSIVAYAEQESYGEGDIVVFAGTRSNPTPVTHRIVSAEMEGGETLFVTQGDANEDPDFARLSEEDILGAVFLTVPYAGYVVAFLRTEMGFFLLIVIPVLLLIISAFKELFAKDKARQDG